MLILQIVVLALIQGITEFLPISSSGHLLLVPVLTDWPDQGILTDVMVHMGSFLAVVVYFWRDCVKLTVGGLDLLRGRVTPWGKMALLIAVGTVPAIVFGVFLDKIGFMDMVRDMPLIVAVNAIAFGILLYVCDRFGLSTRRMSDMTLAPALIIGVAQAIAIIPGTSRSGICMTAARALGFERPEAARFAFCWAFRQSLGQACSSWAMRWRRRADHLRHAAHRRAHLLRGARHHHHSHAPRPRHELPALRDLPRGAGRRPARLIYTGTIA